jgi:redox-sensitive bicupin YhaK (pirin superfamily)
VLDGTLEHQDNIGNGSIIKPTEVQRMSAGKGILHSEFNPSATETVHLLQIWLIPATKGLEPSYEQKQFDLNKKTGQLILIASPDAKDGSVIIHQDVKIYGSKLNLGDSLAYSLLPQGYAWIQVARGSILLNDLVLYVGDGAAISTEKELRIEAKSAAELLLFELN